MSTIKIHESWLKYLKDEFDQDYMIELKAFLKKQYGAKKEIYPQSSDYFNALNLTPFDEVKCVVVGQDPYHGPGQAHGLCFSVPKGVGLPPSLRNIFQELQSDIGIEPANEGDLTKWAVGGVLLLNSVLTVEKGHAGSHQAQGWERFTDKIISVLNEHRTGIVYILWGSYAQKKGAFIDRKNNLVIESPHPSPLSSYRGFFGSKPFSKANNYLKAKGVKPIDWHLS